VRRHSSIGVIHIRRLLIGAALAFVAISAWAQPKLPPDGKGIKWSTAKKVVKDGKPVTSQPWPDLNCIAVAYEVELEREATVGSVKKSTILVWVFDPADCPKGKPVRGWCHGTTFDDTDYSPYGSEVPFILAAGWEEIECTNPLPKGAIIVYYDGTDNDRAALALGKFHARSGASLEHAYDRHAKEDETAAERLAEQDARELLAEAPADPGDQDGAAGGRGAGGDGVAGVGGGALHGDGHQKT